MSVIVVFLRPLGLRLIVGLALIESLAIYTLVVVLILLYAKPFGI